ncbi:MAG: NYN domain-containing protein [Candidatus Omnitrophota bacterium]
MALQYILDGYNIVHQLPALAPREFKSARGDLARFVEIFRPQGSVKNIVTIVFDGWPFESAAQNTTSVKIVFSQGETADDRIRRILSTATRKKNIIVVTDDKELRFSIRALGADVLNVKDFVAQVKPRHADGNEDKSARIKREENKTISKTLEHEITSELEKIWLKDQ